MIDLYLREVLTCVFKNVKLIENFVDNVITIVKGCITLDSINKKLQANGIEKISEKEGKDIWFLERMCGIIKKY